MASKLPLAALLIVALSVAGSRMTLAQETQSSRANVRSWRGTLSPGKVFCWAELSSDVAGMKGDLVKSKTIDTLAVPEAYADEFLSHLERIWNGYLDSNNYGFSEAVCEFSEPNYKVVRLNPYDLRGYRRRNDGFSARKTVGWLPESDPQYNLLQKYLLGASVPWRTLASTYPRLTVYFSDEPISTLPDQSGKVKTLEVYTTAYSDICTTTFIKKEFLTVKSEEAKSRYSVTIDWRKVRSGGKISGGYALKNSLANQPEYVAIVSDNAERAQMLPSLVAATVMGCAG